MLNSKKPRSSDPFPHDENSCGLKWLNFGMTHGSSEISGRSNGPPFCFGRLRQLAEHDLVNDADAGACAVSKISIKNQGSGEFADGFDEFDDRYRFRDIGFCASGADLFFVAFARISGYRHDRNGPQTMVHF